MATVNWRVGAATQTEAQWTSENPILLPGETAVSSDQVYTGTDQRKFKMGNGTDRWNDLDYMPVGGGSATTPTLEQVRTAGNAISGTIVHSVSGGVLSLSDTTPSAASATLSSGDGMVYANNTGSGIGTNTQTVGVFTDFSTETTVIKNSSGTVTLLSSGSLDIGGYQIKSLQAGSASTDAVNKSQLDAKQDKPIEVYLTGSNQTNSTVTPQVITGLTAALAANSRYAFRASVRIGCSGAAGTFFSITLPAGATMAVNVYGITTASTVDANQLLTTSGTETGSAFCRFNSTACMIDMYGTITTGATAGNSNVLFRSATAGQISTVFVEGTYGSLTKFV
jgi:hypothetical protein